MAAGDRERRICCKHKALGVKAMAWTLSSPGKFKKAGKAARWAMHNIPFAVNNPFNQWYKQREMPEGPTESFGEWFIKKENKSKSNE
jgi:L-lactate dehydrogenase complex protein LldF